MTTFTKDSTTIANSLDNALALRELRSHERDDFFLRCWHVLVLKSITRVEM